MLPGALHVSFPVRNPVIRVSPPTAEHASDDNASTTAITRKYHFAGDKRTPRSQIEGIRLRCFLPHPRGGGSELDAYGFPKFYPGFYKRVEVRFLVSSAAAQPTPVPHSYLTNFRPGAIVISYHHVLQNRFHLPHPRRFLRRRLSRSSRQ